MPWETDIQRLTGQQIDVEIVREKSSSGYQTTSISHNYVRVVSHLSVCGVAVSIALCSHLLVLFL